MLTVAYIVHKFVSMLFLMVIPLPFLAFAQFRRGKVLEGISFWRALIFAANISLILVLVSGLAIFPNFLEWKTWVILILSLALGACLGIMSKGLTVYMNSHFGGTLSYQLKKITYAGFAYVPILALIIGFMINWNFI